MVEIATEMNNAIVKVILISTKPVDTKVYKI